MQADTLIVCFIFVFSGEWPKENFHFGLSRDIDNSNFVWQNGEALTFKLWMHNRPDNHGGNQHCGVLDHRENHTWNDVNCINTEKYICEIVMQ